MERIRNNLFMMTGLKSALIHSAMKKRLGLRKFSRMHIIAGILTYILFEFTIVNSLKLIL